MGESAVVRKREMKRQRYRFGRSEKIKSKSQQTILKKQFLYSISFRHLFPWSGLTLYDRITAYHWIKRVPEYGEAISLADGEVMLSISTTVMVGKEFLHH